MQATGARRLFTPLALAVVGGAFALLALVDKLVGLVQHPLHLATLAYASLTALLALAFFRGIPVEPARLKRLSVYAAFLLLNVLTAAYVLAWRLSADPTPVLLSAELRRGDRLLAEGQTDAAHLVYRAAYGRYPRSFPVLMRMGAINYQVSDFQRAQRYFSQAVEAAPAASRWKALNDLGQTYWKLKRPEEALGLYERAREEGLPPDELTEWHYRMAYASFDARDYDGAITHFQEVARAGGDYGAASYYNLACAQAQKLARMPAGEERRRLVQEAVENLRRAWRSTKNPDDLAALKDGLVGSEEDRDPELQPLRGQPAFNTLLREITGPAA